MRGRSLLTCAVTALAVVATGGAGITAAAAAGAAAGSKGAAAPTVTPAVVPPGYKVVHSTAISVAAGQQQFGAVTCPKLNGVPRVPLGGGIFISSISVLASVNGSEPTANGWEGWANNGSSSATTFTIWAICGKKPSGYAQVSNTFSIGPGTQASGSVTCPTGTKVSGGGGVVAPVDTAANLNTSIPQSNGWRIDANNGTAASTTFTVAAVCGKWPSTTHYGVHQGTLVTNSAASQNSASIACPSGQSALGGGVYSSSGSTFVNINSTYPLGAGWNTYMNNNTSGSTSMAPYVICAT